MLKIPRKALIWFVLLPLLVMLFFICPQSLISELKECYFHLCAQLLFIYVLWTFVLGTRDVDMLEPIVLVSFIHVLLFEITPVVCLLTDRISFFGTYVWGGCIKGTYISTLGYCVLMAFYYSKSYYRTVYGDMEEIHIEKRNACLYFNYIVWIIAFICNFIVILGYGLNIRYLLTGGRDLMESEVTSKSSFGFLVIIAYAMIPSFLYILELGKNKIIKVVFFYLMFMSFYVRGFRFIMIAVLMAPIIYNYLKKNKRPKLYMIVILLIALSVFSGYMQFARAAIRAGSGGGIDLSIVFNFENITDMLIDNFEIVKTYYAIVEHFPKDVFYLLGSEMIVYTLVLFVPRFIWPGKPQPPIYTVISGAVNDASRTAGTSYPYIGEYYFEFGVIGVCVCMAILGRLLRRLQSYMYTKNCHDYVLYSCVFPLLLQILIRGYTPTNFYMILAVILPTLISRKIVSQE